MEEEQIIPASKETQKSDPGVNKALVVAIVVLLLAAIGAAAYWFGTQRRGPEPVATSLETATSQESPAGSPTTTPKPTKSPKPTNSPTPTPTSAPNYHTMTINSTASLDGWRASNGGYNNTWYIQVGHNSTLTERGFVSFDISSIPSGVTIDEVKLRLFQGEVVGTPYASSLIVDHLDYGTDLSATAYDGSTLASNIGTLTSNATVEWKDLLVTDRVKNDISSSRSRSQFRLRFATESTGPDAWARFESGDNYLGTGNLPQIVIKYH